MLVLLDSTNPPNYGNLTPQILPKLGQIDSKNPPSHTRVIVFQKIPDEVISTV